MPDASPGEAPVEHVFIVGMSRTGTTLTRNILNRNPDVGIGGESRFFTVPRRMGLSRFVGFGERFASAGDLRTDDGLRRIVDAVFASSGRNYWAKLAATGDRARFETDLRASDRSLRALLDAAMALVAGGRRIRGEKTPAHLAVVPRLLEWFPDARIVHCMRDPRAVYVSDRRKYADATLPLASRLARATGPLFQLYAALDVALQFRRAARLDRRYAARFPGRYLRIRFEDLVRDPVATVRRLSEFLGIAFEPAMLEQPVANSSYVPRGEPLGIDPASADRWRAHLHPLLDRWLRLWCGRDMRALGDV